MNFRLLDSVITEDGDLGCIVFMHDDDHFDVEVVDDECKPIGVLTMSSTKLKAVEVV